MPVPRVITLPWASYSYFHWFHCTSLSPSGVYTERYNRTVRYDWLGQYLFSSLNELQDYTTKRQWLYHHERPDMELGDDIPIVVFITNCLNSASDFHRKWEN
ncbi:hypothetical protein XBKB1_1060020 [Xenorhabdus bovienii str. kraussei Becker Underwood]|uniref:Integrase catalytic domain-containing protein n=1 Tax=Xenorhabdus bovienii str. kraussei Becker Underwood TaxID=1398204 RepID=A0A077PMK9_XENBV|nr:hypothetical protein XBKB1_1060020 [Xenorhabdus bovienii str. kraussei Becker Underwood]